MSAPPEPGCPFCSPASDRAFYTGHLTLGLWDQYPVAPGHALLVPKRHVVGWFDATAEERAELMGAVEIARQLILQRHQPDGFNIGINIGAAAGQTVFHLHVHVIPRYEGDVPDPRGGVRGVIPSKQQYGPDASRADAPTRVSRERGEGIQPGNPFADLPAFIAGEEENFGETLCGALKIASEVDIVSAFVQPSGLKVIRGPLEDALERGARARLITGDYFNSTSADALRDLLALRTQFPDRLEVRFHQAGGKGSLHAKSYIFVRDGRGIAYVGSSNLSEAALTSNVEWNLRAVTSAQGAEFEHIRAGFERLLRSPQTVDLTREVVEDYALRAPVPLAPEPRRPPVKPHSMQEQALSELRRTRENGMTHGLVVMATGLGKTYLSALDFRQMRGERALFVAHRKEILTQAQDAWGEVFPDKTRGLFVGDEPKQPDADLLFASVQTLAKAKNLRRFSPDHFDYVVVDEFHHAAARTYRKILGYFQARFLLGLTATPDRMDGASLMELCHDNRVCRIGLAEGISRSLLVPFRYYGVLDEVDFEPIPWRSGKFDAAALTEAVATQERATQALREYRDHAPDGRCRTLAFCCSIPHANFTANYLNEHGVRAAAVHSDTASSEDRSESLKKLISGDLEVICAVDVFNEGLDIPDINVVLMLRPTESPVIFLQQLGRGLRRPEVSDKKYLTIVDFIGNHRSFLSKPQALVALTGQDVPAGAALEAIRRGQLELPEGCSVDIHTEIIDMLERVSRVSKEDMLVYEYVSLRDSHGRRPAAAEVFATGVHMKPVKDRHGTWFDFVRAQGDLKPEEQAVLGRHREWFADLMKTGMRRSYKMVTLKALLERDALHGEDDIEELAAHCRGLIQDDLLLQKEIGEEEDASTSLSAFVRMWKNMPLRMWAEGKSISRQWFELGGSTFRFRLEVAEEDRELFDDMTGELVDLRLAEHKSRLRSNVVELAAPIRLRVSHAGGRPIIRFDRARRPDIPEEGEHRVVVDEEPYLFRFRKIAVNVAVETHGGPNVLPTLLRQWFGPSTGHPGTRHHVLLSQRGAEWHLTPDVEAVEDATTTVIPFPALPFYADLKVACGAFDHQYEDQDKQARLRVQATVPVDPKVHFVVRASGDSMDGGERPIRDGDLVLCEWLGATTAAQVEGKAVLVSGYESDGSSLAAIKVPIRDERGWLLRSWNTEFEDLAIPSGTQINPVARVVEVVEEAAGPTLWGRYDRQAAAAVFGMDADRSWQVGHRDVEVLGEGHSVLFVTLRKPSDTPLSQRYADRFVSAEEFQWESQASTTPTHKKGRNIIEHEKLGRKVHLFCRHEARQPFVYCGTMTYLRHQGSKPIRIWSHLDRPLPNDLWRLWSG